MSLLKRFFKQKKCFVNPHALFIRRSIIDVILWKVGFYDDKFKNANPPLGFTFPILCEELKGSALKAQWMTHSSYLVNAFDFTFLTDPVWSDRCSPISFLGPKRKMNPPCTLQDLPLLDCILISHNHYDHLDKTTIKQIIKYHPGAIFIVPQGVKKWFERLRVKQVIELSWWESVDLPLSKTSSTQVKITAVPAQHFSGRGFFDFNKSHWCGYVVEIQTASERKRCYFAGDTGYNSVDFKEIQKKWPYMDLSLIPIGCYSPRVFMAPVHIDPWDAISIHIEVNSRLSLATHWGTFSLGDEGMYRPPYDLYCFLKERDVDVQSFLAPMPEHEIHW